MKKKSIIAKVISMLMILSLLGSLWPNEIYADEATVPLKMQGLQDYTLQEEQLSVAVLFEEEKDHSHQIHAQIEGQLPDKDEMVLVFQKGMTLNEESLKDLPEHLEVVFPEEDEEGKAPYGAGYTFIRVKAKASSETSSVEKVPVGWLEEAKNILLGKAKAAETTPVEEDTISDIVIKSTESKADEKAPETISESSSSVVPEHKETPAREPWLWDVTFDIERLEAGDLLAVLQKDNYAMAETDAAMLDPMDEEQIDKEDKAEHADKSVIQIESHDAITDEEQPAENGLKLMAPLPLMSDLLMPRAYMNGAWVLFVVQTQKTPREESNRMVGQVPFQLYAVDGGREIPVGGIQYSTRHIINKNGFQGNLLYERLSWHRHYRLYVREVPQGFVKPEESVVEFYFDASGIHWVKGNTSILLYRAPDESHPLDDGEHYGFIRQDGKIGISKELSSWSGREAFCLQMYNDFPPSGKSTLYHQRETSPDSLGAIMKRSVRKAEPRAQDQEELYNRLRQVIAFTELHKEELLTTYQLNRPEWTRGDRYSDYGVYQALQRALWYYTDSMSLDDIKDYKKGSILEPIIRRAIEHILRESEHISPSEMDAVELGFYETDFIGKNRKPFQALLTYKVHLIELCVQKVDAQGHMLDGATFQIKSLSDDEFPLRRIESTPDHPLHEFCFTGLPAGRYELTEEQAPLTYQPIAPVIFEVVKENDGLRIIWPPDIPSAVTVQEDGLAIVVKNDHFKGSVDFSKEDTQGNKLDGVKFILKQYDSRQQKFITIRQDILSTGGGHIHLDQLDVERTYQLWETDPLPGFKKPHQAVAEFKVDRQGKVTISSGNRVIKNKRIGTNLKVVKQDKVSHTPLGGAVFEVFEITSGGQLQPYIYQDESGHSIRQWRTAEHTGEVVIPFLKDGHFLLREVKAPQGYKLPALTDILLEARQGSIFKVQSPLIENTLIVSNEKLQFSLKKIDEHGVLIKQTAVFSLYRKNAQGDKGEAIAERIHTEQGLITFKDLTPGEFLLYEEQAPDGYQPLTEPYHIVLNEKGEVSATYQGHAVALDKNMLPIVNQSDRGFVLPEAGGAGYEDGMHLGIVLLFSGFFAMMLRRRRKIGY